MIEKNTDKTLEQVREKINKIDEKLLTLVNERALLAAQTAEIKKKLNPEEPSLYRPEREALLLRNIMATNPGPIKDKQIARLFRELMSVCLAYEQLTKVAYLGPEGTFTQQATYKHFGHTANSVPMSLIDDVFREVQSGSVDYGMVPVENSTEGGVHNTLDSFVNYNCKIVGEVELQINQNFMISDVTQRENITKIYSHSQSLAQCRKWLDNHYPNADRVSVSSNAEAAKRVKTEWNSAAIAGEMAAELYELIIIEKKIEDRIDNSTRFFVLGNQYVSRTKKDKTSIVVSPSQNKPGALYELLTLFKQNEINLTRIETRPSNTDLWEYIFFIDFFGHQEDAAVANTLKQLNEIALKVKILGSYPQAVY